MPSLLSSLKNAGRQMSDEMIANDMIMGSEAAAAAYLAAALKSTTPELRAMFSGALNQIVGGHESMLSLAVNRGWLKPYDMPEHQLQDTFKQSQDVLGQAGS